MSGKFSTSVSGYSFFKILVTIYSDVHKETKKKSRTRNRHFGMLNTQITYPHKHPNVYSCDTLMELISYFRSSANNLESNSVQTKRCEQIPYYSVSRKNKSGCSVGVTGTMGGGMSAFGTCSMWRILTTSSSTYF